MGILARGTVVLALLTLAGDASALQRDGGLSTGAVRGGHAVPHAAPTGRIAPVPTGGMHLTPPPGFRRAFAEPARPAAPDRETDNALRRMIRLLMAEEKTTHLHRMAQFERHLTRATREGDTARVQEIEAQREQEVLRHQQAMASLKALRPPEGAGRAGPRRERAGNGAPMPPKPCPQRTAHGLAHRGRTQPARQATPTIHAVPAASPGRGAAHGGLGAGRGRH